MEVDRLRPLCEGLLGSPSEERGESDCPNMVMAVSSKQLK